MQSPFISNRIPSDLVTDVEQADEVLAFFDGLLEAAVGVDAIVAATAARWRCSARVRTHDGRVDVSVSSDGSMTPDQACLDSEHSTQAADLRVWICRQPELDNYLDQLIRQRFVAACTITLKALNRRIDQLDRPELVYLVLTTSGASPGTAKAVMRLGLQTDTAVRAVGVTGPREGADEVQAALGGTVVERTTIEGVEWMLVLQDSDVWQVPVAIGCRVGVGRMHRAVDGALSRREALVALRFAMPSTHGSLPYSDSEAALVIADRLGCWALIAESVTPSAILDAQDVRILDRLAVEPGGVDMIRTLEAVAATESIRRAAGLVHLHHSSVGHRVARAEDLLGFSVNDPYGRSRLMLALVLQRLKNNGDSES